MAKAWTSEKSAIIDHSATMVSLKDGKAKLIGMRAAASQARQIAIPEMILSVSGWTRKLPVRLAACRAKPSGAQRPRTVET